MNGKNTALRRYNEDLCSFRLHFPSVACGASIFQHDQALECKHCGILFFLSNVWIQIATPNPLQWRGRSPNNYCLRSSIKPAFHLEVGCQGSSVIDPTRVVGALAMQISLLFNYLLRKLDRPRTNTIHVHFKVDSSWGVVDGTVYTIGPNILEE